MLGTERQKYYEAILDVPDFPKTGIVFKDITPLLLDSKLLEGVVAHFFSEFQGKNVEKIVAIESRGFIIGAPLAIKMGVGLVLARKEGKLPRERHRVEYDLEYGTDVIEVHRDSILKGERVLVVDDVLATGGTAQAAGRLVTELGGVLVGMAFLMELEFLSGRSRLEGIDLSVLLPYS